MESRDFAERGELDAFKGRGVPDEPGDVAPIPGRMVRGLVSQVMDPARR